LSVPDIFKNGGITNEQMGAGVMPWIHENGDFKKNHINELILAAVEDLRKDGCTSFSIFGQCWGALMAIPIAESVDAKGFDIKSFHKRYENMHHGWTGGRGDWTIAENREAGLDAVDHLGAYFAKVEANSKL
ncbi:hypothetical protein BGZ81_000696, partial [Podila clonocystis]